MIVFSRVDDWLRFQTVQAHSLSDLACRSEGDSGSMGCRLFRRTPDLAIIRYCVVGLRYLVLCVRVFVCSCVRVFLCVCVFVCDCMFVDSWICLRVSGLRVCIFLCLCVCVFVCVWVKGGTCVYVIVFVCLRVREFVGIILF